MPPPDSEQSASPQLVADEIAKSFPTRGEPLVVLRGASLALSAGENAAIVGPSGSGKSTLLHILGTLDTPTSGRMTLLGVDPFTLDEPRLAAFRNRHIGFVFQEHYLLPQLTVLENTLIPALAEGPPNRESIERAKELLERVGLSERLEHRPAELSGGERQRVAVARALLNKPALLLADEPTGSLDRTNALAVGRMLLDLQAAEKTMLVVVTHSSEIAAMFERRFQIDDGRLQQCE
jgi:lipoprotein-releasing system ATP-binding protein